MCICFEIYVYSKSSLHKVYRFFIPCEVLFWGNVESRVVGHAKERGDGGALMSDGLPQHRIIGKSPHIEIEFFHHSMFGQGQTFSKSALKADFAR